VTPLAVRVERCTSINERWLQLRRELWPDCPDDKHFAEMKQFCANPGRYAQFIAYDDRGAAIGMAEASLRTDYVNGASSSPVAFLEGLYVVPDARRLGVARALVEKVERWGRGAGCRELASDARIENELSRAVHESLGFDETERVVCFLKELEGHDVHPAGSHER
jgi:aminoglycoside 6'-N-acetyltransferase I